jgi:mannose-6-phosphate isomerase-like protein (cupin superfamily)
MIFENIEKLTIANDNFRQVIATGINSQLVLMSLLPNEDIGEETHDSIDQILCIIEGEGEARLDDKVTKIQKNSVVFVKAGTKHNIVNSSESSMKLYTIYSPAAHEEGCIHKTKADAGEEEHYA